MLEYWSISNNSVMRFNTWVTVVMKCETICKISWYYLQDLNEWNEINIADKYVGIFVSIILLSYNDLILKLQATFNASFSWWDTTYKYIYSFHIQVSEMIISDSYLNIFYSIVNCLPVCERSHKRSTHLNTYGDSTAVNECFHLLLIVRNVLF